MNLRWIAGLCLLAIFVSCPVSLWAAEASVYDELTDRIVRAYSSASTAKIELRNPETNGIDSSYTLSCGGLAPALSPVQIASGLTSADISLSFDASSGKAYVFYTTAGGLQLTSCAIGGNIPSTYSISGKVSTTGGSGISGVTMGLSGTATKQTNTDGSGNYVFSGLSNGSYTVTPALTGYSFSPSNSSVTISGSNGAANFTGSTASANVDLQPVSVQMSNCCQRGVSFSITVSIRNNGTGSAGAFKVKTELDGPNSDPPFSVKRDLCIWSVTGLGGGQSTTLTCSAVITDWLVTHTTLMFLTTVDFEKSVAETNEGNNTLYSSGFVPRTAQ